MIANPYLARLIDATSLGLLLRALKNGFQFTRMTGWLAVGDAPVSLGNVPIGGFVLGPNHDGGKRTDDDSRGNG